MEFIKDTEILKVVAVALLLVVYFIAKAFADKIWFRPHQAKEHLSKINADWLLAKGKYSWDKRTWWTKYIFSFLADGWHFMDSIRTGSFIGCLVIGLSLPFYWFFILWFLGGVIFEVVYNH